MQQHDISLVHPMESCHILPGKSVVLPGILDPESYKNLRNCAIVYNHKL